MNCVDREEEKRGRVKRRREAYYNEGNCELVTIECQ
jgi:hypothetical protein